MGYQYLICRQTEGLSSLSNTRGTVALCHQKVGHLCCPLANLTVGFRRKASQFQKIAQDSEAPSLAIQVQGIECSQRGGRAGTIGIVKDQTPTETGQWVEAPRKRLHVRQGFQGLREGHVKDQPDGHGGQRSVDVVLTEELERHSQLTRLARTGHREEIPNEDGERQTVRAGFHSPCDQVGIGIQAICDYTGLSARSHGADARVIVVEYSSPALAGHGQGFDQTALLSRDNFQGSQVGQVRLVDRGHDTDLRAGERSQLADLILAIAGHLQHSYLVLRIQLSQGDGQAVLVVVVPKVAKGGVTPGKNSSCQLLGRGLAGRARHSDDARAMFAKNEASPVEERLTTVVHDNAGDAMRF
jgi:hypothetical protein